MTPSDLPLYYEQADFNALAEQLLVLAMKATDPDGRRVLVRLPVDAADERLTEMGRKIVEVLELVAGHPIALR